MKQTYIGSENVFITPDTNKLNTKLCSILTFKNKSIILTDKFKSDYYNAQYLKFFNIDDNFKFIKLTLNIDDKEYINFDNNICKYLINNDEEYEEYETIEEINSQKNIRIKLPWKELDLTNIISCNVKQKIIFNVEYFGYCDYVNIIGYEVNYYNPLLNDKKISYNFKQILYQDININNDNIYDIKLTGLTNGLFIYGLDSNNIDYLELNIDNEYVIELNKYILHNCIKRFDDKCFYLPFDNEKNHNLVNVYNSINLTNIQYLKKQISIIIEGKNMNNFTIYSIIKNRIDFYRYTHKLLFDHNDCNNIFFNNTQILHDVQVIIDENGSFNKVSINNIVFDYNIVEQYKEFIIALKDSSIKTI